MVGTHFAQIGRVAYIAHGNNRGRLCVIIDIFDQNRALVDGPNVARGPKRFKAMHLTKFLIKIPRGARTSVVEKYWKENDLDKKWRSSNWFKKIHNRICRATTSDFDRFKLQKAKKVRNHIVYQEMCKLKHQANRKARGKPIEKVIKPKGGKAAAAKSSKAKPVKK